MDERPDFKLSDSGEPRFALRYRSPKEFRGDRPVTVEVVCAEPIEGGWVAWWLLVPDEDGTPVVAELRIFPQVASVLAGGLPTNVVRKARPDYIRRLAHDFFQYAADTQGAASARAVDSHLTVAGYDPGRVKLPAKGRGGQRRLSDEHLAVVAAAYADRVGSGSRRPRAEVAELLGESSEWVRDRIVRARKAGILTAARHGLSGGRLTEKGSKLLKQRKQRGTRPDVGTEDTQRPLDGPLPGT